MPDLSSCPACGRTTRRVATREDKRIYLDPDPVEGGMYILVPVAGGLPLAAKFRPLFDPADTPRYQSHFKSCKYPHLLGANAKRTAAAFQRTKKKVMEGL